MSTNHKRTVIVHYHIFKNAGSTIDHLLENNLGKAWVTFDGEMAHSRISPGELEEFIRRNPTIRAVSSHNAILPVPDMPDILIAPIVFIRHPLDRVRSIYDFERHQGLTSGPVSRGAEHAARLSFDDYLQWRFDSSINGVTHNHHTAWLLHHPRYNRIEIRQQDYEQALQTLNALPFFGMVERFDDSLRLLDAYLKKLGMDLDMTYQAKNISKHHMKPMAERLAALRDSISNATYENIEARNQWDLKLYSAAETLFKSRLDQLDGDNRIT